jgi:hypothetical protein
MAMMCSALLAARSPPRLRWWRAILPCGRIHNGSLGSQTFPFAIPVRQYRSVAPHGLAVITPLPIATRVGQMLMPDCLEESPPGPHPGRDRLPPTGDIGIHASGFSQTK